MKERQRRNPDMQENITVRGARVNNLKNVSLTIPRDKLVAMLQRE